MPFLLPNQQYQSTIGKVVKMIYACKTVYVCVCENAAVQEGEG